VVVQGSLEVLGIPITGWISSAGILSLVGLFLRRDVALRKLSHTEAADLRDSYAAELAGVRAERVEDRRRHQEERVEDRDAYMRLEKHMRDMLGMSDQRHKECEDDRKAMRQHVTKLEQDITGLNRKIIEYSAERAVSLDPSRTPHASASAERVRDITNGDK